MALGSRVFKAPICATRHARPDNRQHVTLAGIEMITTVGTCKLTQQRRYSLVKMSPRTRTSFWR